MRRLGLTFFLVATFTVRAFAQVSVGGTITGTISDEQGVPLPGVTVTAQGVDATRTFTTGADGRYSFLTLALEPAVDLLPQPVVPRLGTPPIEIAGRRSQLFESQTC